MIPPLLALVDASDYYADSFRSVIARLRLSSSDGTGSILRNLECGDCIVNIRNYELRSAYGGVEVPGRLFISKIPMTTTRPE